MKFDLKAPCKDCPFRRSRKFPLRPGRVDELERGLVGGDGEFACHKTVDYSGHDEWCGDGEPGSPDEQHCAGAEILLMKIGMPNQMMRIMGRIGAWKYEDMRDVDDVFDDFGEMRAQMEELDRPRRRK